MNQLPDRTAYYESDNIISPKKLRKFAEWDFVLLRCIDRNPMHNAGTPCRVRTWFPRAIAQAVFLTKDPPEWELEVDPRE